MRYLLGEHVMKFAAKDETGAAIATPPCNLILSYELEIRHELMRQIYKGQRMDVALRNAWENPVIKERFFTTPLGLVVRKRPREAASSMQFPPVGPPAAETERMGKPKGKKQGISNGAVKRKGREAPCSPRTPDGRSICFSYNRPGEKCAKVPCRFAHVCGSCFGARPQYIRVQAGGQGRLPVSARRGRGGGRHRGRHRPARRGQGECQLARMTPGKRFTTATPGRMLRVLHLFAGAGRRGPLGASLRSAGARHGLRVELVEVHVLRDGRRQTLIRARRREHLLRAVRAGSFDALVLRPPSRTFSRARWSSARGPPPVRSRRFLRGFPWLRGKPRQTVLDANIVVDFMATLLDVQLACLSSHAVLEHPEDLGNTGRGVPGTIWQLPILSGIAQKPGVLQGALKLGDFGAPSRMPTRFLGRFPSIGEMMNIGPPVLDSEDAYLGKLSID